MPFMKRLSASTVCWLLAGSGFLLADQPVPPGTASNAPDQISTWCRYIPERSDDFAWENDLAAFRTYGPALAAGTENSGIDCWPKHVAYPIVDKWYRLDHDQHISYHTEHGEGYDNYHTGKSRGCGGTAVWANGKMYLSGVYKTWNILQRDREKSVFELTYQYDVEGRKIQEVKRFTIELGKRLFRSESTFTENGKPASLDVAVGITTHDQRGKCTFDRAHGWMAVWEIIDKEGFGTGVVIDPARITDMREVKSSVPDESHALLLTHTDGGGKEAHYTGYGWEKAGAIKTPADWDAYLAAFAANLH